MFVCLGVSRCPEFFPLELPLFQQTFLGQRRLCSIFSQCPSKESWRKRAYAQEPLPRRPWVMTHSCLQEDFPSCEAGVETFGQFCKTFSEMQWSLIINLYSFKKVLWVLWATLKLWKKPFFFSLWLVRPHPVVTTNILQNKLKLSMVMSGPGLLLGPMSGSMALMQSWSLLMSMASDATELAPLPHWL